MKQRLTLHAWVSIAALVASSPAVAQSGDPPKPASPQAVSDESIEDIVVTAQRRSESLQKTALTIQVLSSKELTAAGVTSASDLTAVLPGVQIGSVGPDPSVYIRGVGAYGSTAGQSPAVPFYVDGVYLGRSQGLTSEFYDVDRLEVLKGPQGTLYGRNATGGAINVLTHKPELNQFSGHGEVEIGNYGNQNGEAAINIPIGTNAALRASGQIVDKGGYTSEGFGDDRHQSARVKLLWAPGTDFTLLLNASYGHIGGRGAAEVVLNRNIPGWYPWLDSTSPQVQAISSNSPINGPFNPAIGQFGPGSVVGATPDQGIQNLHFWNFSGEANWSLGSVTLTLLPAYRYSSMQYTSLHSFLFANGYGLNFGGSHGSSPASPETSKQSSVEVRVSSDGSQFKWTAGAYFFDEAQSQQFLIYNGAIQNVAVIAKYGTRSYAAFGQGNYGITDDVRLIGGLRYTSDRRSISDGVSLDLQPSTLQPSDACFIPLVVLGQSQCATDRYAGTKTFHNVSWKAGIEADASKNILIYATASRGFKAGGFNTQSTNGNATREGDALRFEPEVLTSYEAGFKGRFLGNRLQVNVEGFYWKYQDHQEPVLAFTPNGTINLIYFNAGGARIYGADVDVIGRPWRAGTIVLNGEYAPSKYSSFVYNTPTAFFSPASTGCPNAQVTASLTRVDCTGFEVARTPRFSGSASFTQQFDFGAGKIAADASVSYASSRWLQVDFVPLERAKPYATTNLGVTYHAPHDRWFVNGFVRNVNNGRAYSFSSGITILPIYVANIGPPRTYGMRAGFTF